MISPPSNIRQQNLIEKITREKIYNTPFWKEKCFGISAESLVDLAAGLRSYGGAFEGAKKSTSFLCLTLKMLQIQPEHEIVLEFIKNEDQKYTRLLGALYLRLVGRPVEIFQYLEPLLSDFRRVRHQTREGRIGLDYIDVLVDELLHKDSFCGIVLPRIPRRHVLEGTGQLDSRTSGLAYNKERALRSTPLLSARVCPEKVITWAQSELDMRHQEQNNVAKQKQVVESFCRDTGANNNSTDMESSFYPRKRVKCEL